MTERFRCGDWIRFGFCRIQFNLYIVISNVLEFSFRKCISTEDIKWNEIASLQCRMALSGRCLCRRLQLHLQLYIILRCSLFEVFLQTFLCQSFDPVLDFWLLMVIAAKSIIAIKCALKQCAHTEMEGGWVMMNDAM